ncbi:hypothetical protein HAX54_015872 [Datura stramonium]|uniref:Uncharacterized protein n=1 Tax=Datura stramonium TaxID=4076 RepID=A0ABS8UK69_DATST|nr:hypothetical protein [Datura stramonium]
MGNHRREEDEASGYRNRASCFAKIVPCVAKSPAPEYKKLATPTKRDMSNFAYASDEERAASIEKAEKLEASLDQTHLYIKVRSMLPSHVSGGFWLGLPSNFCRKNFPRRDDALSPNR